MNLTSQITSVMLVDDNEGDHLLTEIAINEYDPSIKLIHAYDGQEALDLLNVLNFVPSVILVDINMSGMNGIEFLRHYNNYKDKSSSVIMLTSSSQEQDRETCLSYDFVKSYVVKPFNEDFLPTIRKEIFKN